MSETNKTSAMTRDLIFISHANPEDDIFSRWLALQLAREGYPVWCDLTNYLGGEDCWKDADKAIKEHTCKFLFVLSRTSNDKAGVLKELMVAENVVNKHQFTGFIIPLKVDDLPHDEINIQLARLKTISFEEGWATGLDGLLKKLEGDQVAKNDAYSPSVVASWWRSNFSADEGVQDVPEECLSNWFPITDLPETIYAHTLTRGSNGIGSLDLTVELPYPGVQRSVNILSFAKADDFKDKLGQLSIENTREFFTASMIGDSPPETFGDRNACRNIVIEILRLAWQSMVQNRDLPISHLANDRQCFYFSSGLCGQGDKIHINGEKSHRQMVGYSSVRRAGEAEKTKRYWHFGIQGYPIVYPEVAFVFKSHVVFSDDGQTVWESKKRLHKARRSQCSNWWNDAWRDRLLCAAHWLSGEGGIELPVASDTIIHIASSPLLFTSPVSYVLAAGDLTDETQATLTNGEILDDDEVWDDEDDEEL